MTLDRKDIEKNRLGNPGGMELLKHHSPTYWFAAHLHCKFTATVRKENEPSRVTKFIALDKCLPEREFLEVLELPHDDALPMELSYDLEWLAVLFLTNDLLSVDRGDCRMPGPADRTRCVFTPTDEEKKLVERDFDNYLRIPLNFEKTVESNSTKRRVGLPGQVHAAGYCFEPADD